MIDWSIAGPLIDELIQEEGHTVTICNENPEFNGLPQCAILACNSATGFTELFYRADSVIDCLEMAIEALYPDRVHVAAPKPATDIFGIYVSTPSTDVSDLYTPAKWDDLL